MLVVSRKENESITIEPAEGIDLSMTLREVFAHGPVLVTLTQVGRRRVRLLIDAPKALKVWRSDAPVAGGVADATTPVVGRLERVRLPEPRTLPDLAKTDRAAAEVD